MSRDRERAGTAGEAPSLERLYERDFDAVVRLAALLGAEDPANVAGEAFSRMLPKFDHLDSPDSA